MNRLPLFPIFPILLALMTSKSSSGQEAAYPELSALLQSVLVAKLPREFEERSNWGKTVRIFDGLKFTGQGFKTKVRERKKEVPHGTWKRFRVWFDDPSRDVALRVRDVRRLDAERVAFVIDADFAFHGEAELKQWSNGVHLLGVTTLADMRLKITLRCEVAARFEAPGGKPELVIEPKVTGTDVELTAFDLKRVGTVLRGKLAHELGDELRGEIRKQLNRQEPRIRAEANEAIAKSLDEGKIRISPLNLLDLAKR